MRMRERGIGNLPFIAVLVLFVVAIAMWFITKSDADNLKARLAQKEQSEARAIERYTKLEDAYAAVVDVLNVSTDKLAKQGEDYPKPDEIKKAVRDYLMGVVRDVSRAGEATLQTKNYQVPQGQGVIQTTQGEQTQIKLYGTAHSEDTITVRAVLDPLAGQFAFAKQVMEENNQRFHDEFNAYTSRVATLQQANQQIQTQYQTDVREKSGLAEGWKTNLDETRTNLEGLTTRLDALETELSQVKTDSEKQVRTVERERNAWRDRAINEKTQKELALAEDPKDGETLVVSETAGTVWLNLGTRDKVNRGMKFTVWRPGKGNVREDVGVVRVINVDRTRAEANIIKLLDPRVPVTSGMNVSNPFYDPKGTVKVYIYGDLRRYPTDIAARRLAASGANVSRTLDDTVNVIVLGEPPLAAPEEMPEDEAEAAALEKKQRMERDKRLEEVRQIAISVGAVLVTEDVLSTFVDY